MTFYSVGLLEGNQMQAHATMPLTFNDSELKVIIDYLAYAFEHDNNFFKNLIEEPSKSTNGRLFCSLSINGVKNPFEIIKVEVKDEKKRPVIDPTTKKPKVEEIFGRGDNQLNLAFKRLYEIFKKKIATIDLNNPYTIPVIQQTLNIRDELVKNLLGSAVGKKLLESIIEKSYPKEERERKFKILCNLIGGAIAFKYVSLISESESTNNLNDIANKKFFTTIFNSDDTAENICRTMLDERFSRIIPDVTEGLSFHAKIISQHFARTPDDKTLEAVDQLALSINFLFTDRAKDQRGKKGEFQKLGEEGFIKLYDCLTTIAKEVIGLQTARNALKANVCFNMASIFLSTDVSARTNDLYMSERLRQAKKRLFDVIRELLYVYYINSNPSLSKEFFNTLELIVSQNPLIETMQEFYNTFDATEAEPEDKAIAEAKRINKYKILAIFAKPLVTFACSANSDAQFPTGDIAAREHASIKRMYLLYVKFHSDDRNKLKKLFGPFSDAYHQKYDPESLSNGKDEKKKEKGRRLRSTSPQSGHRQKLSQRSAADQVTVPPDLIALKRPITRTFTPTTPVPAAPKSPTNLPRVGSSPAVDDKRVKKDWFSSSLLSLSEALKLTNSKTPPSASPSPSSQPSGTNVDLGVIVYHRAPDSPTPARPKGKILARSSQSDRDFSKIPMPADVEPLPQSLSNLIAQKEKNRVDSNIAQSSSTGSRILPPVSFAPVPAAASSSSSESVSDGRTTSPTKLRIPAPAAAAAASSSSSSSTPTAEEAKRSKSPNTRLKLLMFARGDGKEVKLPSPGSRKDKDKDGKDKDSPKKKDKDSPKKP